MLPPPVLVLCSVCIFFFFRASRSLSGTAEEKTHVVVKISGNSTYVFLSCSSLLFWDSTMMKGKGKEREILGFIGRCFSLLHHELGRCRFSTTIVGTLLFFAFKLRLVILSCYSFVSLFFLFDSYERDPLTGLLGTTFSSIDTIKTLNVRYEKEF